MLANIPETGLTVGTTGGEWTALALARSEWGMPTAQREKYIANVEAVLKAEQGVLHKRKYTEYSRVTVAWTALGLDARNVGGYSMLERLSDYDKTIWQGLNGPIWALIAADTADYSFWEETDFTPESVPAELATRKKLLDHILNAELAEGGWALDETETKTDIDITAMALQALAGYRQYPEVEKAVQRALERLRELQTESGGFIYYGAENCESSVQVLVALCALGLDPLEPANGFVKPNGANVVEAVLSYAMKDGDGSYTGAFEHIQGGNANGMAGDQGMYGLIAYQRLLAGKNFLYDMSDVKKGGGTPVTPMTPVTPEEKPESQKESDPYDLVLRTISSAKAGQTVVVNVEDPTARIPMDVFTLLKKRGDLTLKIAGPYYNWYFKAQDITDTSGEEFNPWVSVSGLDDRGRALSPESDFLTVSFEKLQTFPGKSTLMVYRKSVFLEAGEVATSAGVELYDITKNKLESASERFAFDKDWLAITITEWRDYLAVAQIAKAAEVPAAVYANGAPSDNMPDGGEELLETSKEERPAPTPEELGYVSGELVARQRETLEELLRNSSGTQKALKQAAESLQIKYNEDMKAAIAAAVVCEALVGTGIAALTGAVMKRKFAGKSGPGEGKA